MKSCNQCGMIHSNKAVNCVDCGASLESNSEMKPAHALLTPVQNTAAVKTPRGDDPHVLLHEYAPVLDHGQLYPEKGGRAGRVYQRRMSAVFAQ